MSISRVTPKYDLKCSVFHNNKSQGVQRIRTCDPHTRERKHTIEIASAGVQRVDLADKDVKRAIMNMMFKEVKKTVLRALK